MPKTFVVFENNFDWKEHCDVNTALLMTLRHAYPEAEIHFIGSNQQVGTVESEIIRHSVKGIHFHPLWIAPTHTLSKLGMYRRAIRKFICLRRIVQRHAATDILFTSFGQQNFNLLGLLGVGSQKANCYGIVHIFSFLFVQPENSWKQRLYRAARRRIKQMRLIELGPFMDELTKNALPTGWTTGWINLPYLYPEHVDVRTLPDVGISFFFLGGTRKEKGFDYFCELANQHVENFDSVTPRFAQLGKVQWKPPGFSDQASVELLSEKTWIDRNQYDELARSAHYVVMPYCEDSYLMRSSGGLCDAITYGLPIIATDIPSIRYYFEQFGNIGYLCESPEAMSDVVGRILRNPPHDEYLEQQRNLHKARRALSLQAQSPRMHEIFGSPE